MAIDHNALINSMLTPWQTAGTVDFSGIHQAAAAERQRQAQEKAGVANDANLEWEREKFEREQGLREQKFGLEEDKADSKKKKDAGEAYDKSLPGLESGDQARARGELNKLEAEGFEVEQEAVNDGVIASPFMPDLPGLEMPGTASAPGLTAPPQALSEGDLEGAELPGGEEVDPGETGTGSLEGFGVNLTEDGRLELDGGLMDIDGLEIVPTSDRNLFHVKSPTGEDLGKFDITRQGANNLIRIRNTLGHLSEYYAEEHPLPAALLNSIAEDVARTVLGSPEGTMADALQSGTDIFFDLVKEENKNRRAAIVAKVQSTLSTMDVERGANRMRKLSEKAREASTSLGSLSQAHGSVLDMRAAAEAGEPVDTIRYIGIMYDIIRGMEGRGARITDKDFERAFGIESWSGAMKQFAAGKLQLGSFAEFENLFDGTVVKDRGEQISKARLDKVEEYLIKGVGRQRERLDGEWGSLRQYVSDAMNMESYAYANGLAMELRTVYPERQGDLPITTPGQALDRQGQSAGAYRNPRVPSSGGGQPAVKPKSPAQKQADDFAARNPTPDKTPHQLAKERLRKQHNLGKGAK